MSTAQDPVLDQGVLSANQVPGSPNYGTAAGNLVSASVTLTKAIYRASKSPAFTALWKVQDAGIPLVPVTLPANPTPQEVGAAFANANPVYTEAVALAAQGYIVDPYIDALGNDPVVTMVLRQEDGIAYTTPLGQPSPQPTPANPAPGAESNPIPGAIKTSTSAADYPPYVVPTPAPAASMALVGGFLNTMPPGQLNYLPKGGYLYRAGPGALAAFNAGQLVNGQVVSQGGVNYTAEIGYSLMGPSILFFISN